MSCRTLLIASVVWLGWCGMAQADEVWQVRTGTTTLSFFADRMEQLGLKLGDVVTSAEPDYEREGTPVAFLIGEDSTLAFHVAKGAFRQWAGGELRHAGGFALHSTSGARQNLGAFQISYKDAATREDLIVRGAEAQALPAFDLSNAIVRFNRAGTLFIGAMDVAISPALAKLLGRPELAGELIGLAYVNAYVEKISGNDDDDNGHGEQAGVIDVQLFAMSGLTAIGRTGTFPNGSNGLAMSTTACNVGSGDVQWRAPMNENHPVIAQQLYRIENDRFEQVGLAWLKHGFFATNSTSSGCAPCTDPGTGSRLGPGCSDTYGTGNNSDRFYLGMRSEVNPFTGKWTCKASWFSNFQQDCIRRNDGSGLDGVAHRLEVRDADLGHSGATYYYEACYILQGDEDKTNNIGYRQVSTTWTGSLWSFSSVTNKTFGPALNVWGDVHSTAAPTTEGTVYLALKTKSIAGGLTHYEYALYNFDSDREVRAFSIPIPPGVTLSGIGFRDIDQNAANDWTNNGGSGGLLTWQTQTYDQNPAANSLKFCTVYNFWFDANSAPVNATATLGLFKPGTEPQLTAAAKGPAAIYGHGDLNCDGVIDFFDVDAFVLAVSDPVGYAAQYPGCNPQLADINCDNTLDFFDIDPFVDCVLNANCGCP